MLLLMCISTLVGSRELVDATYWYKIFPSLVNVVTRLAARKYLTIQRLVRDS